MLAARAAGATQLFISDLNDTRLEMARSILPGVVTLNPKRDKVDQTVRAASKGGVGCDVAIECVGNGASPFP